MPLISSLTYQELIPKKCPTHKGHFFQHEPSIQVMQIALVVIKHNNQNLKENFKKKLYEFSFIDELYCNNVQSRITIKFLENFNLWREAALVTKFGRKFFKKLFKEYHMLSCSLVRIKADSSLGAT